MTGRPRKNSPKTKFASDRRKALRDEVRRFETVEDTATYVLSDIDRTARRRAGLPDVTVGRRVDAQGRPKRIHPDASKNHGTASCYQNQACRCLWVPGTGPFGWWPEGAVIPLAVVANLPVPGCDAAGRASARSSRERRNASADTVPLRTVPEKRHTGTGRVEAHDQPRPDPPAGSAFSQLMPDPFTAGAQPA